MKLKKVLDEIQKTEERITEWQEHLRELNIRKKQLEDAEIIKSIRSMKLNSRELLVVLDKIQNGTAVFPYLTEETTVPDTKKEEDWKDIAEIIKKRTIAEEYPAMRHIMNLEEQ